MTSQWSPRARELLSGILRTIAHELHPDDALRWHADIDECVMQLEDFPHSGTGVPLKCFETIPPNADELRQTFCRPYRIVYEVAGDEIHILSIRHSRMLVTGTDTYWN